MFVGGPKFWKESVLGKFKEHFTISHDELEGIGSSVGFLKRKIVKIDRGLGLVSGGNAQKAVKTYEEHFGKLRNQTIPCGASVLVEDLTQPLSARDAFAFGSIIGICLYVTRDRPDILYAAKELSSFMSKPTHGSLQRLKKLIGYLRATPTYCLVLETPMPGQGKWKSSELTWVLESFTDADWSSNQCHRRSTSCGIHLLCGSFIFGSSRTQRVVSLSSCESELHAMISTEALHRIPDRCQGRALIIY